MRSIAPHLPITEVVVMEDRAQVLRRALVQFEAGRSVVRLEGLADTVVEKTVSVSVVGPAEVVRVRVLRESEALQSDASKKTSSEGERDRALLDSELNLLEETREVWIAELKHAVEKGHADPEAWRLQRERLFESERSLRERLQHHEGKSVSVDQASSIRSTLVVEIECTEAGPYPIQIDYVVANATWRPCYEARLDDASSQASSELGLAFRMQACVWQHTGEAWDDAELVFTTQRTTSFVEPPHLPSDIVRSSRKSSPRIDKPNEALQSLAQEGGATLEELPFPDDGGRALRFKSATRMSVPSDGMGRCAFISGFETQVKPSLIVQAQSVPFARRRVNVNNRLGLPLLPGPIELVSGGGWVGHSWISWIGSDEGFELDWGNHPDLVVVRESRSERGGGRKGAAQRGDKLRIDLRLSNLAEQSVHLIVEEQLPRTSEGKFAEIDESETTGSVRLDDDGALRWPLTLEPLQHATVQVGYRV